ncbi:MAG: hypothetical protein ACOCRN_04120 [Spirochaetia bacterium]
MADSQQATGTPSFLAQMFSGRRSDGIVAIGVVVVVMMSVGVAVGMALFVFSVLVLCHCRDERSMHRFENLPAGGGRGVPTRGRRAWREGRGARDRVPDPGRGNGLSFRI